ncbi:hypothetical protein ACTNDZ_00475 [Selenomonas montiformis]|uniref:hypothetical protein n=1 Tax=Selenomonas montiformis TaxID=2652285 RepID=UPI003F8C18B2
MASEIQLLDSMSTLVLKMIAKKSASISNLSFVTSISMENFSAPITLLLDKGYIKPVAPFFSDNQPITPDTIYTVTLSGSAYLESISRLSKKERWQRNFNYFNATIATIALLKSFFPELTALWKLLTQ